MLDNHKLLPWEASLKNPNHGWLVETEIKQSTIKGAGLARFSKQFIPEGKQLLEEHLIDVYSNQLFEPNELICLYSQEELEHLITRYHEETQQSKQLIREKLIDFLYYENAGEARLHSTSAYRNHKKNANMMTTVFEQDDPPICKSKRNILPGEELFLDYGDFHEVPEYVLKWCERFHLTCFIDEVHRHDK